MSIPPDPMLLTSKQMAEFVSTGMLRLEAVIDPDICARALHEIEAGDYRGDIYRDGGKALQSMWRDKAVGEAIREPRVAGAIQSLVGENPRFDHMAAHLVPARTERESNLHQDAELDQRFHSFDIQLSFFFQDITPEMGGTLFVPGSHFRQVRVSNLRRYHHIRGQVRTTCPSGTVIIWHANLWHAARSNRSDRDRYMFKVRLNPQEPQVKLWDCRDLDDQQIEHTLNQRQGWMGNEYRTEIINRIKLWRALTDQPAWDMNSWLTRLECRGDLSEDYQSHLSA